MARFAGLCAGGPFNGQKHVAETPRFIVPIIMPSPPNIAAGPPSEQPFAFTSGEYKWNEYAKMWIWQGKWMRAPDA
jgi:hypothetical protein